MNRKTLLGVLALMFVAVAFTSCGDDDDWWAADRLVGVWHTTSYDYYSTTDVRFYGDGTGEITQYDNDMVSDYSRFTWDTRRGWVYMYYDDREPDRWRISFDGRNAFRLYFDDGDYALFVRDY